MRPPRRAELYAAYEEASRDPEYIKDMSDILPPQSVSDLILQAEERGRRMERVRCAEVVGLYPIEGMSYDTNNQGELLRLRDTLSEACLKVEVPGQGLK